MRLLPDNEVVKKTTEIPTNVEDTTKINENLSYKIIDDNTVYLNILSFYAENIDEDSKKLLEFYEQINGYKNLIIDLTKCDSGSDTYWQDIIVKPNITEQLSADFYSLTKSTGIYKEYADNPDHNRSYVLVGGNVYSATEGFARVCKETRFLRI